LLPFECVNGHCCCSELQFAPRRAVELIVALFLIPVLHGTRVGNGGWYGMESVSVIDMDMDTTWSRASVGVAVAVLQLIRNGSEAWRERIVARLVHGIQIRASFSNTTEASFIKTDRNAGHVECLCTQSCCKQTERRTSRPLARTFYHDVWDPPGNKTISPGWSRPRSLLRV
jgi:hypothetical protein